MVRKTCSKILGLTVLTALVAFGARAQQAVTELSDDFQSYGTQANPPGWIDSSVGTPRPEAGGLYKTWPDPTQGNQGANIVYGTKQASGKPEGNNPRIGTFSTYTAKTFSATGRFEYRGRFIRTNDDSRIGFSVLSSYPQTDQYYLIGLWSQTGSPSLSMQLFSFGAGAPAGRLDSLFTPDQDRWYQFLIQVDDSGGKTNIRARFWLDGTNEPATWSIDASDSSTTRLTSGFLGIWSAVKGEVYVDDLKAKSPVDHEPPVIRILEDGADLPEGKQFNRFATPVIQVTDDTPNPTATITLDGNPFVSGTQITVQGNHTLTVVARDSVGNEASLTRHFFIDSIPPVVTLYESGNLFPSGEPLFDRPPVITATTQDISTFTTTLFLDGAVYTPGTPVNVEKEHFISAKSVDALLLETNLPPRKFTVDLFPPVVAVTEGGQPLVTYYDRPSVTPVITVTDATETVKNYLIKEGGASRSFTSGTALTNEAKYELAGSAKDAVNRTTSFGPLTFYIDRTAPVVKISANGAALVEDKIYGGKVTLSADVTDLTLDVVTVTVDGQTVTLPFDVTAPGAHEIKVVADDKLDHTTTVVGKFVLDLAAPLIDIRENGEPLPEGKRFNRPVTPVIAVTDDTPNPIVTITLDGDPFVSGTVVTEQGEHALRVHAEDTVGNEAEVVRHFFIDSLPPVVTLLESGEPFPPGEPLFDRPPLIDARTVDASKYTTTLLLKGEVYVPNTPIDVEKEHVIGGDSVDELLNRSTIEPRRFTVDLFAPVITVTDQGQPLVMYYDRDVAPVITVADATETTKAYTIKEGEASRSFTSGETLTNENKYELAGSAKDLVNRITNFGPLTFYIDRTAPIVNVSANGLALTDGKVFAGNVTLTAEILDLTLDVTTVTLDGGTITLPHEVVPEGRHEIVVTATDKLAHSKTVRLKFIIDRTGPQVTLLNDTTPFPPNGSYLRVDPIPDVSCTDALTDCTPKLVVDGVETPNRTPITVEGPHTVIASATDEASNTTTLEPVTFILDKTPPVLTVTSHADGAVVTAATVVLEGGSDDAVTVTVDGTAATVDDATQRYRSEPIALVDGENVISLIGIDPAGNTGTTSIRLLADMRNPDLQLLTPAPNACIKDQNIAVTGTVRDVNVQRVRVTIGEVSVDATLDAEKVNWTASLAGVPEGQQTVNVEATDTYGRKSAASITILVDRAQPAIEILESGAPFTRRYINRPVSFFVRVKDLDQKVSVVTSLGNVPYVNGASIASEGDYRLTVTATDCAGNASSAAIDFTVDLTPPVFSNLAPGNGATVAARPSAISGSISPDAVTVNIEGGATVTPQNGAFTLNGTFTEGTNAVALHAVDRAGNETRLPYNFTVRSNAPVVYIREGGSPLQDGTVFNRAVTLDVSADDPTATVTATLNSQNYTGAAITEDGTYTIAGRATNSLNLTGTLTRNFRIDRTGPVVKITSPTGGDVMTSTVTVTGTATDAISVNVNGIPATLNGTNFTAVNVPLETGENEILAVGYDAAGNSGRDAVTVNLVRVGPGILITEPLNGKLTNRPRVDVAGRVLSQPKNGTITVGPHTVTVDATGAFRYSGYELTEGDNVITATAVNEDNQSATSSVTVIADFTPPQLAIRANNELLADEQRFPDAVGLSLTATDDRGEVTTRFWLDGFDRAVPLSITANGGHVATAVARDKAGNETRVERTFFIGSGGGTTGCTVASVDPIQGTVITADRARITGRAPGAVSVTVAGKTADFANGSFTTEIPLPVEGENSILVQCTDASGVKADLTRKLVRVTGQPWIDILEPAEGHVTDQPTITVSGKIGDDIIAADINGKPAILGGTPGNRTFTATDVSLTHGINVLAAHARNAAQRLGTDSVRVRSIQKPPEITITAPVTNYQTGLAQIPVSGTYVDVDPTTIAISGGSGSPSITFTKLSDTTGNYLITNVGIAIGENTLTVTGRNPKNKIATASVTVSRVPDLPSIVITDPPDNAWLRPDATNNVTVSGIYAEPTGSSGARVDVNANAAVVEPVGKTYTGTAPFVAGQITPLVARYTNDAGAVAIAVSRVNRLGSPLTVKEAFPAVDAQEVDPGAVVLIFFSAPVSETAVNAHVSISTAAGPVSGRFFIDDTVVTWAPDNLLQFGTEHTIGVAAAMTDIVGNPIDKAFSSKFTTASTAPATPPTIDPVVVTSCGQPVEVKGTAPAGARLLLRAGELEVPGTAGSDGKFSILLPLSGQSGYQTVRVRVVGADGTFSPSADASFLLDCAGPYVLLANYDRVTNKLAITFSKPVKPSTIVVAGNGSLVLTRGDLTSTGTAEVADALVTVTPADDLRDKTFTLTVMESVEDLGGNKLSPRFDKTFIAPGDEPPPPQEGEGYISGEVYDATTGRPLAGARLRIAVPASAFARTAQTLSGRFTITGTASASRRPREVAANEVPITITADARGRYTRGLPEGAHTLEVTAVGYTTVWRQIVVPAGAGVIPIDIRLTRRPTSAAPVAGQPLVLSDGGGDDNKLTRPITLTIPADTLGSGAKATLTAIGAQSIAGLLPVGWSPLASAEIAVFDNAGTLTPNADLGNASLAFTLPDGDISDANQTLSLVRYDSDRDEWITVAAVFAKGGDGKWSSIVSRSGAYAVVYADQAAGLIKPPAPQVGAALLPAKDTCLTATTPCAISQKFFDVDPKYIPPTGRAVARLEVNGSSTAEFPSGTAVQAYVTETLTLSNGAILVDPPFAADVLLYRTLAGTFGVAEWYLEPSKKAADVVLSEGVDHVEVVEYPGRLDRGTLIGPEGGRVPGDDDISIDIPTGATNQPIHAGVVSLQQSDLTGNVDGFKVLSGFDLAMGRSELPPAGDADGDGVPDEEAPVSLNRAARATVTVRTADLPSPAAQLILVESLDGSLAGRVRLAAILDPLDAAGGTARRYTTRAINVAELPVDGVIREGRYYVLAALSPIAYATGSVRLGVTGPYAAAADIASFALPANTRLGVTDLTRGSGIFALPVAAETQGGFAVVPSRDEIGTGQPRVVATAPARDTVVTLGDLILEAQRPVLEAWSLNAEQTDRTQVDTLKPIVITARFSTAIDANTKGEVSLVNNTTDTTALSVVTVSDRNVSLSPVGQLDPASQYTVVISDKLRGLNGAPLGETLSYNFSTRAIPVRNDFDPTKIRITIPVNGVAVITGDAGSVPGNFGLLGVRRDRDFITKPNTQSDNDGKFTLTVGAATGDDRIEIGDLIDLYVIHPTSNAVWARVPLGPFVSPDFKSFVAPKGKTVTFRSAEDIIVTVEAGTFDSATIVTLAKEQPAAFLNAVAGAANDVNIEAVARVSFEGEARKPLILSMPVPAGVQTTGRYFITSELVNSIRGPKIEAITAAGVVNGNFQSGIQSSTAPQARAFSIKPQGGELVVHWDEVKDFLRGVRRPGVYGFMDIRVPQSSSFGWAAIDAIQTFQEIFFDYLASFVSTTLVSEDLGTRVIPVLTNMPLTIVGVDTSSGLQAFKKVYAPLAPGDPGVAVVLEPPTENVVGPFPVFGLPFRAEVYQVPAAETTDDSIRNFTMTLDTSGELTIAGGGAGPAIEAKYQVEAFHTRTGEHVIRTGTSDMVLSDVKQGDRIVILIEQADVDPTAQVSLTFNEPLDIDTADAITAEQDLRSKIKIEVANEPPSELTSDATFEDISLTSGYKINSGNRRVEINPGALRRGAIYRVTLKDTLGDQGSPQLFTGSVVLPDGTISAGQDISLYFRVRKPHGLLTTFNLKQIDAGQPGGALRELSQRGNILFVAALDGGLQAYDMSNPVQLGNTGAKPFAMVEPGVTDFWGVATDHHNRVYTVGLTNAHGVIRSYRVEQFTPIPLPTEPSKRITGADQKGNAIVSMRPGYGSGLPQTSATLLSDRPEAIPRKITLLVQDKITDFKNRAFFEGYIGSGTDLSSNPEWRQYTYTHAKSSVYERQRVTIENISQGLRWSADATDGSPAVLSGIIATRGDKLRMYVNERTYGVVPLIGYGFSVFDLLAMESNDVNPDAKMTERVVTTRGEVSDPCNQGSQPDNPCHIPTLASTPDVQLRSSGTGAAIKAYALDPRRGLLDVMVAPPAAGGVGAFGEAARAPYGLPFIGDKIGGVPVYHPRIKKLAEKYQQYAGRWPVGRFSSLSPHHWSVTAEENAAGLRGTIPNQAAWRDYMVVAGHELGVLIVETGGKPLMPSGIPFLENQNLVDVIWTPAAALAVRVIPDTNFAVVLDQLGRVLLIDLSRIDERWDTTVVPPAAPALTAVELPFPTSWASLQSDNPDAELTGKADPRIIWISPKNYGFGTLPPVIDPDTGMIYTGEILGPKVSVIAALDPKILVKADIGDPFGVLKDIGGIVPLGVKPPAPPLGPNLVGPNASLAAFRVEVGLPGAMAESLPATSGSTDIPFVVESERMTGATTEQTPPGFPRAHLRRVNSAGIDDPNPAEEFKLRRFLPDSMASEMRHQKGFNKFVSPWVVGIADFRASRDYNWPGGPNTPLTDKENEGCYACDRPEHLKTADEPDAFEIYTNGRLLSIHADTTGTGSVFDGTLYEYLGQKNRLGTRIVTVMADTMRTKEDLSAAQNPPVAGGTMMGTVYLHSGELQVTERDLSAGGRGGMDVNLDRVYRSRTTGTTPFGQNWESPWFRRLRALPNGHVEYRDSTGELWLFKLVGTKYESPKGLFLRLGKNGNGWQIVDQKWRRTMFDQYGRIISEEDQFATLDGQNGNYIRYIYDAEGRLKQIVDPVYRTTALRYWEDGDQGTAGAYPGMIKEVKDWRDRKTEFEYDADGRLTKVRAPARESGSASPLTEYKYTAPPSGLNLKLDGQANLEEIVDPAAPVTPAGSPFRVKYAYNSADDELEKEEWGSGETVTFTYPGTTSATNNDIYGQERSYTLTDRMPAIDYTIDRQHITKITEAGITVASVGFGNLPIPTATSSSTTDVTRETELGHNTDGTLDFVKIAGVRETRFVWESVEPEAPGTVLKTLTTSSIASLLPGSSTPAPIVQTFNYQSGTNARTFLRSIDIDGKEVQSVEPHRNSDCDTDVCATEEKNNLITSKYNFDVRTGQAKSIGSTGGNDTVSAGASIAMHHWDAADPKHKRGLIRLMSEGSLETRYDYPSANEIKVTDPRGYDTTVALNDWDLPKTVSRTGDVPIEEGHQYDDRGQVTQATRKQGSDTVTTTYKYDRVGRVTETETDNVNTPTGTMKTTTQYVVTSGKLRKIITKFPGDAEETAELDNLGRTTKIETDIGPYTPLRNYFTYDLDDNVVHTRDDFTATTAKYDAFGRPTGQKFFDLTSVETAYDGRNRPTIVKRWGADNAMLSEQSFEYEAAGALKEVKITTSTGTRVAKMAWDGAGRPTGMAVEGRATHVEFDSNGRAVRAKTGPAATASSITDPFAEVSALGWDGTLPTSLVPREPRGGSTYSASAAYNALGDMKVQKFGSLSFEHDVDQAGNVTRFLPPGIREETTRSHDARGAVKTETPAELGSGLPNEYKHLASGVLGEFKDTKGEKTQVVVADRLGRPIHRTYADGTHELFAYEGTRIKEYTDRQGRKRIYEYSPTHGKLEQIRLQGGGPVETYGYDTAGRLDTLTSYDGSGAIVARLKFEQFDYDGNPHKTTQTRFRAGSVLDEYTQTHSGWNAHGERTDYTMPSYTGQPNGPWIDAVKSGYDDAGNVNLIQRSLRGSSSLTTLMSGVYRNTARPITRTVTTAPIAGGSPTSIMRAYEYDASTALPKKMAVTSNGLLVAGTETLSYDGLLIQTAKLLGVAGDRVNEWTYDKRGRVRTAKIASNASTVSSTEQVEPWDFRSATVRTSADPSDPPSLSFTEQNGHKIDTLTRGSDSHTFTYNGAERLRDGRYEYEFDWKGRLVRVEELPRLDSQSLRRVRYEYNAMDRVVGRIAEFQNLPSAGATPAAGGWIVENRQPIIAADSLPAESTFAWDPLSDQLVAIFKAGASKNPAIDAHGGLVKQIIHGGLGYDDPIEVSTLDPDAPSGVDRLYPIFDETATGNLQVLLNVNGEVVARTFAAGAYGEEEYQFVGAAVDNISFRVKKSGSTLESVEISIRATESLDPDTAATGGRLAAMDGSTVVRTSTAVPVVDGTQLKWTLTAAEWNTLIAAPASRLSMAVTDGLRALTWAEGVPVLPAPQWAMESRPIFTSTDLPVELREPVASLNDLVAAAGTETTTTLYEVASLAAVGAPRLFGSGMEGQPDPTRQLGVSTFHAHPFQEPVTGHNYVRARWYDPLTGTFLTPDPMGYQDSSNLYAFAGGDPVNGRDPTGLSEFTPQLKTAKGQAYEYVLWAMKEGVKGDELDQMLKTSSYTRGFDLATLRGMTFAVQMMGITNAQRALDEFVADPRTQGGLQAAGRCTEMVVGALAAETGIGAVAAIHGADGCQAGIITMATGERVETETSKLIQGISEAFGASPEYADPASHFGDELLAGVLMPAAALSKPSGYIRYKGIDDLARPTGIEATITEDMLGTGTTASQAIRPPGFQGGAAGHARGHLLGRQLGGSGTDYENLVTLFQNPVNTPVMSGFENMVANAVRSGQTVRYSVTPIYAGDSLVPRAVTLTARGSGPGGLKLNVTILNQR